MSLPTQALDSLSEEDRRELAQLKAEASRLRQRLNNSGALKPWSKVGESIGVSRNQARLIGQAALLKLRLRNPELKEEL